MAGMSATDTAPEDTRESEESTPKKLIETIKESRPVRALQRYGKARGGLLAGGIAYSAIFSIVAALTIAWTVFMATIGGNEELRSQVIEAVNEALPGILQDGSGQGMINPDALVLDSAVNVASIVAALVLLWTAIGMMTNIRSCVQDMFGIVAPVENPVLQKVRDLLGFIAMAFGIVSSALLGTAASTLGQVVIGFIGLDGSPVASFLVRAGGLLAAAAMSAVTFAFLFRVTAAVRPLRKDLWLGSAVGGVAVQVILFLGTSIVSSVSDNPLLAASASLATLLLFVNLLARVLLMVAAFTANPPAPNMPQDPREVHFKETPNFVTESAPHTLHWDHQDVTGQVSVDDTLNPDYRAPKPGDLNPVSSDRRPDGAPIGDEPIGPLKRLRLNRRAQKLERKAVETRRRLGQRPRIDAAEESYWEDQDVHRPGER
ncbi:hypothetical protein KILIM_014_00450 [Kineosphaera limosa NBRC 100340]|uniref:Uncharacterized protein n=2 Tax=Kineosphaera TaxID=211469 RepID=K6X7Y4_9MICO|nr:hypothetical protein KILIM_014_00450 [Kineosphaera limosa NBRC 100340]